jgi:SAM-dependent methyltransferase
MSAFPFAAKVLSELRTQAPFLARAAETAHGPSLHERLPMLDAIAARLDEISTEPWVASSVKSYIMLSLEFLKLQRKLEQTGRYFYSTERETFEHVYNNKDVIGFYYLAGLLLSQALWTNHFGLSTSFARAFVPSLQPAATVLEIGVGTGYHLRELIKRVPDLHYDGLDISTYAVDFARTFAIDAGTTPSVAFRLQSATSGLPFADAAFDAAICSEVLEHVEDPGALLREIRRTCRPNASLFMTTVVFAANIDHIYLFEDANQIRALIRDNAWSIEQEWIYPVYDTDPEAPRKPASYGAILKPAR